MEDFHRKQLRRQAPERELHPRSTFYKKPKWSSAIRKPSDKTFPLLKLPPELRGMIYEPLIQAGDLGILRVSKLVNREAVPHLSKAAILRINQGCPDVSQVTLVCTAKLTLSGYLSLTAPDYIQHLDLRLDVVKRSVFPMDVKLIGCFSGNAVARKSCKVTIKFGVLGPVLWRPEGDETYRAIGNLTGFKVLTLRLEYRRDAEHEAKILTSVGLTPMNDDHGQSRIALWKGYRNVSDLLTARLGEAQHNNNIDDHCIKFWPSKYNSRGHA